MAEGVCHRVSYVYDERMMLHRSEDEPDGTVRVSSLIPEKPERIKSIYDQLLRDGLLNRCHQLDAREASRDELMWLHDPAYLDLVEKTAVMNRSELNRLEDANPVYLPCGTELGEVYLCNKTYQAALLAAGSALRVAESILSGESRSGVGIIRPPGHHTEGHSLSGFCFYNNTALAAKYALDVHRLERVLIVDWDIHHGNGIQKMFLDDPRILYISLHRIDLYPFVPANADCNIVGTGPGAGYNINIPWSKEGMGDTEYLTAFNQIILPIAYQFNPQLVLVAAGFDSASGDPLGHCEVSPEGFGQMTHLLSSLAQGRIALLLEGGYNLESISKSMSMCVRALLGDPLPSPLIGTIDPDAAETIRRVLKDLSPFWKNLKVLCG